MKFQNQLVHMERQRTNIHTNTNNKAEMRHKIISDIQEKKYQIYLSKKSEADHGKKEKMKQMEMAKQNRAESHKLNIERNMVMRERNQLASQRKHEFYMQKRINAKNDFP